MKHEHIILLLDSDRFGNLRGDELLQIETHSNQCDGCRRAFMAAKAAAELLKARAAETIEPTPFFSTRVMALIREEEKTTPLLDLATIWNSARGFVFSTVSVLVLLMGLTLLMPGPGDQVTAFSQNSYSTEGVMFGDEASPADESPSNEQVMDVVFTGEETDASNQK